MIKINQKIKLKSPDIIDSKIDDELVMIDINNGNYYGINKLGCVIWELIKSDEVTVSQVCDRLQERFEVPRDICEKETLSFLEVLLNHQLIEVK